MRTYHRAMCTTREITGQGEGIFFLKFIYLRERERERAHQQGKGKEREGDRILKFPSRIHAASTEPDMGLEPGTMRS